MTWMASTGKFPAGRFPTGPRPTPAMLPVPPIPRALSEIVAAGRLANAVRERVQISRALDLACERIDELEDALRLYAPHVCNDLDVIA